MQSGIAAVVQMPLNQRPQRSRHCPRRACGGPSRIEWRIAEPVRPRRRLTPQLQPISTSSRDRLKIRSRPKRAAGGVRLRP
jgi:hypothetical protein